MVAVDPSPRCGSVVLQRPSPPGIPGRCGCRRRWWPARRRRGHRVISPIGSGRSGAPGPPAAPGTPRRSSGRG